jgi:transposase
VKLPSKGMNESAGVNKPAHIRHGNTNLKRILGTAAMAAVKQKDTYYSEYYRRIAGHDPQRAIRRITKQANALGLTVRFDPIEA